MRRRLFSYTAMYTAGIISGFYIFERTRIVEGAVFMITVALAVIVMHRGCPDDLNSGECMKLIAFLVAGMLVFSVRYAMYESMSAWSADSVADQSVLTGRIISVKNKDEGWSIIADCVIDSGNNTVSYNSDDTDNDRKNIKSRVLIRCYEGEADPAVLTGRMASFYGKFTDPAGADNPGCFDYRLYLRSTGVALTYRATGYELVDESEDGIRWRLRRRMMEERERFLGEFGEDVRGFVKGVIFGDKSDIDEDTIAEFNANSTGHILAVSGLHIGFLYSLMRAVMRRRRTRGAAALVMGVLIAYGEMTMWSPSTMRAVTVMGISLLAVHVRRPYDMLSSLSAAALVMLIVEPYQLFNTGFQMSFLAMMGIAVLAKQLAHVVGEYFGVMLAVQMAVAPIAAFTFHRFNPASILINIPVIALASILVPLCMVLLVINIGAGVLTVAASGAVSRGTPVRWALGMGVEAAEGLADIIVKLNGRLSEIGTSALVTRWGIGIIVFMYLAVFTIFSEWSIIRILRKEWKKLACAFAAVAIVSVAIGAAGFNSFLDDEVVFVSVGQGDCTHIRTEGKDVLIDGGGRMEYNVGEKVLMPYLLSNGADRVELALVTHLHMDHYKGIEELSECYPVGKAGIPDDYRKAIEQSYSNGLLNRNNSGADIKYNDNNRDRDGADVGFDLTDVMFVREGERITISDSVYIEPVWPLASRRKEISIDDPNENNMVYIVHYWKYGREIKVMVTGDLLEEDEHEMVRHYRGTDTLKCDILKVAHHGSKSSSSEEFLDMVLPEVAVISVGKNNLYGHPHEQTLDRLAERGIRVYRTDENGAVGIDVRRAGIYTDTMR